MLRILLLLASGVFFSSAFSEQVRDEVAVTVVADVVYGHDYGRAIAAFAPPTDLTMFVTDNPTELENQPLLRLTNEQFIEFSPVAYVTPNDPPTLIMHGNADDAVPIVQGKLMFYGGSNW